MNFLSPHINSVGTLERGFLATAGKELDAVGDYDKSLSTFFATCLVVIGGPFLVGSGLFSVYLFEKYHTAHTDKKIDDFISIANDIARAVITEHANDGTRTIQVGRFTLTETKQHGEADTVQITITDEAGQMRLLPQGITLGDLKEKAALIFRLKVKEEALELFKDQRPQVQAELVNIYWIYYAGFKNDPLGSTSLLTAVERNAKTKVYLDQNPEIKKVLDEIFPLSTGSEQTDSRTKFGDYAQISAELSPKQGNTRQDRKLSQQYEKASMALVTLFHALALEDDQTDFAIKGNPQVRPSGGATADDGVDFLYTTGTNNDGI